jgi:hypothetical protein
VLAAGTLTHTHPYTPPPFMLCQRSPESTSFGVVCNRDIFTLTRGCGGAGTAACVDRLEKECGWVGGWVGGGRGSVHLAPRKAAQEVDYLRNTMNSRESARMRCWARVASF